MRRAIWSGEQWRDSSRRRVWFALAHPVLVPRQVREKFLQRAHGRVGRQGHRFHAFARQLGELPSHVYGKMCPRIPPRETVGKSLQVLRQLGLQPTNLFGIHALASRTPFKAAIFVDSSL